MKPTGPRVSRCRKTGRRPSVKGCPCIACTHHRLYARQWARDQCRLNSPYAARQRAKDRARQRHRSRSPEALFAMAMYAHLRRLLAADHASQPRQTTIPGVPAS